MTEPMDIDEGSDQETKVRKSEVTRQKIVDSALDLFREKGYDKTTMRAIAERAGVSQGNAYYYFSSKEALIQGYYELLLQSFIAKANPILDEEQNFADRLSKVLVAWVHNARPYHEFAGHFFRYAAQPTSPMSPFSEESRATREASIDVYRRVVEGSEKLKMPDDVRKELPQLLWMYQMGTVLYWVFDSSTDQENTVKLINRTVPMIARLISLSRLPGLRSTAADLMKLAGELRA